MFCDNTCRLDSDDKLDNLIRKINAEINKIAVWFKVNKMAINTGKSKYIVFRAKYKKITLTTLIYFVMLMTQTKYPMLP
jgi:hypothetical protein